VRAQGMDAGKASRRRVSERSGTRQAAWLLKR
jgi:hypothetical protein